LKKFLAEFFDRFGPRLPNHNMRRFFLL